MLIVSFLSSKARIQLHSLYKLQSRSSQVIVREKEQCVHAHFLIESMLNMLFVIVGIVSYKWQAKMYLLNTILHGIKMKYLCNLS